MIKTTVSALLLITSVGSCSNEQIDQGRIPRTIECELTQDLVDCCIPGDVVTVTGVVKARRTQVKAGNKNKALYVLYLDANSVENGNENESSKLDILQVRHSQRAFDWSADVFSIANSVWPTGHACDNRHCNTR